MYFSEGHQPGVDGIRSSAAKPSVFPLASEEEVRRSLDSTSAALIVFVTC